MVRRSIIKLLLFSAFFFITHTYTYSQTGSDTTCSNWISLFQKIYGGIKDDIGFELAAAADSGYVIAGHTSSFGNGGYDGMLMKVNKKGQIVWSRAIGGSGNDVFYGIKRTSDNGFIACGQTKSYGNVAGDAWLVKLDAAGVVQWSKKYGDGNANGEVAWDVTQLSDGGYAFCGAHQFAANVSQGFVVRTDNLGNVTWSKQYGASGSDELYGLTEAGDTLVAVGFYTASSFYDGYLIKLSKATGAVQMVKSYDAENRSTLLAKIRKTNTGYQVFSFAGDDFNAANSNNYIWNLVNDGTVQNLRKMAVAGSSSDSYGWYPFPDGGFVAVNGFNSNTGDIYFTQVNASGNIDWSKKYVRGGKQIIRQIVPSPQGGYAGAGITSNVPATADSNNVYLVRLDSAGNGGDCPGSNTTEITVGTAGFSTTSSAVTDQGTVTINSPAITVGSVTFVPVTSIGCYYCQYPIPILPPDTTCTNGFSYYHKLYGGTNNDIGFEIAAASDSGFVIVGSTNSYGNGGLDGLAMKVNKRGQQMWSKAIGGSGNDEFYEAERTSDNGVIICGQTKSYGNAAGDAWLVKLDATGTVQWSKKYGDGNPNGEVAWGVTQLSDGGFAFCGAHRFAPNLTQSFVVRTDNLGNVIWSKQYGNSGSDEVYDVIEDGNSLIAVGFYRTGFYDGYLMKLDKATGAVQFMKGYKVENRSTLLVDARKTTGGYQVFALEMDDFTGTNQQQCILNIASDGTVQNIRKLTVTGATTNSYGWYPYQDGGFVVINSDGGLGSDLFFSQVNAAGTLLTSKKYVRPGQQTIRAIFPSPEGGFLGTGINNNVPAIPDSNNVFLMRVDSSGNTGLCSGSNTASITVSSPAYTNPVPDVVDLGTVMINNPVLTVGAVSFAPSPFTFCFNCKPKPTGTALPVSANTEHEIMVYPNPVIDGTINMVINAAYADRAVISVIDINGNKLFSLSPKDIRPGDNRIFLNMKGQLRNFSNYFIHVQFRSYSSSSKIFVLKN